MRALILLALVSATLAGCASDSSEQAIEPSPSAQFVEDRGRGAITVDAVSLPVEPPLEGERTLAQAPVLRLGEWWRIVVTEHFTGTQYEILRVVAGTEHGNYLIGFPIDAFSNDILVLHTPGYGDILPDLSYGAHDVPFVPVKFPLEAGATWTTAWESEGATLDMTVEKAADGTALITGVPTGTGAYATTIEYDANLGEVRKLVMAGYAEYEVVDHGYGYEGDVRVPHAHDLVLLHGRVAGVGDIQGGFLPPQPAPPTENIVVGEGYDRISFALIFFDVPGSIVAQQAGPSYSTGTYAVDLTAPDGTVYSDSLTPADGSWVKATFLGHEGPAGTWQLRAVAGGFGGALAEGIGYHSIDIALPTGCVLRSAAANHHGTLCSDQRQSEGLAQ